MNNIESLKDIQARLRMALKAILIDLDADDSAIGQNFINQYNAFLVLHHPKIQDLLDLEEKIYSYKLQLKDSLTLNFVADYLLLKVKAAIKEIKIGHITLQDNLENEYVYDNSSVSINTLTSVFGSLDVTPRSGIYLNSCVKTGQDNFLVMGSVFSLYDREGKGPLLEDIEALHTITGILNGVAQCHKWALTGIENNLYITKDKTAGESGSSEDTGCVSALIPAIAIAYCWSVFDSSEISPP